MFLLIFLFRIKSVKRKVEEKIKYKLAAISGYKVFAIQLYITYICSSNQNSHLPVWSHLIVFGIGWECPQRFITLVKNDYLSDGPLTKCPHSKCPLTDCRTTFCPHFGYGCYSLSHKVIKESHSHYPNKTSLTFGHRRGVANVDLL